MLDHVNPIPNGAYLAQKDIYVYSRYKADDSFPPQNPQFYLSTRFKCFRCRLYRYLSILCITSTRPSFIVVDYPGHPIRLGEQN